jgi:hypothetical protein
MRSVLLALIRPKAAYEHDLWQRDHLPKQFTSPVEHFDVSINAMAIGQQELGLLADQVIPQRCGRCGFTVLALRNGVPSPSHARTHSSRISRP